MKEVKMSELLDKEADRFVTIAAVAMLAKDYVSSGGVCQKTEETLAKLLPHSDKLVSAIALVALTDFGWDLQEGTKTAMSDAKRQIEADVTGYQQAQALSGLLERRTNIVW